MADSTFTLRLDDDLKAAFAEVAAAQEHTSAQLLRLLMRDEVRRWHATEAHEAWFGEEVARGIAAADDASVVRRPHDAVTSSWQQQRASLGRRGAGETA